MSYICTRILYDSFGELFYCKNLAVMIKSSVKKTYAYDPFCAENNFVMKKNASNLFNFDVILFLSKGSLFHKLYKKIKLKKSQVILDPFYYYAD